MPEARFEAGFMNFMMRVLLSITPFATSVREAVDSICFTAADPSLDSSTGGF